MGASFQNFAPAVFTRCPELREYSDADTMQAAREMQALRKSNPKAKAPGMFRDYGDLRSQCRAYLNQ